MDNITIELRESVLNGNAVIGQLTDKISTYNHDISTSEGYKRASFVITGDQINVEDWFESGLARDVVTYNDANGIIWNGFVNKVSIVVGGRSLSRGPLTDIVNRLSVSYTPIDTTTNPPVRGNKTLTDIVNDTASQSKYGILQDIYNAGDCTDANAVIVRDSLLGDLLDPEVSETLSLQGGAPSVTVECCGYYAFLDKYIYSNTATGTIALSTKLQNVLTASPNAIFSSDYGKITSNTLTVTANETEDRMALDVIKGELAKGDSGNNRYTFGIFANRKAYYAPMPTSFAYQFQLATSTLELYGGGELMPWDVLPGRWMFYTDFLTGKSRPVTDLRKDPRALFIETVNFTAPWGLSLNGGKVRTTQQIMARMGLGGV